jgi:creatinine amidohydrolase/Fe(II)-dependent formamide hydrolase-like protein
MTSMLFAAVRRRWLPIAAVMLVALAVSTRFAFNAEPVPSGKTSRPAVRQWRYELMRPGQIQDAIKRGLPLLIPVGVLEYHGPQSPVGTDALISQGIVNMVAKEVECVAAPTMFYGYTGQWAGGIEKGEIHIEGNALYLHVKPIVKAYFEQGWRRIYIICHHQGPKGVTMLSYQQAATEAAMEHGQAHGGMGWSEVRHLYPNVFERIAVVSDSEFSPRAYGGHGGKDETAAMMYLYPETVDLSELDKQKNPSWAADAHEATAAYGEEIAKAIVASWKKELSHGHPAVI